jgi:hypothetical protein
LPGDPFLLLYRFPAGAILDPSYQRANTLPLLKENFFMEQRGSLERGAENPVPRLTVQALHKIIETFLKNLQIEAF